METVFFPELLLYCNNNIKMLNFNVDRKCSRMPTRCLKRRGCGIIGNTSIGLEAFLLVSFPFFGSCGAAKQGLYPPIHFKFQAFPPFNHNLLPPPPTPITSGCWVIWIRWIISIFGFAQKNACTLWSPPPSVSMLEVIPCATN